MHLHWFWTRELGKVVADRHAVDMTNSGFLKQYAVVFAASTVLVLVLWLLAVAKRAIRGVPMTTAISEAVGLLWLTVLAAAFTPLILYTVIGATSAVTDAMVEAFGGSTPGGLFDGLGARLKSGDTPGGPLILAAVSLATVALCGALWLLLVLRALGLYVGALLGVVVYAGLVDKNLWGHVRRWAGFMIALILIEPVVIIVLGMAAAMEASDKKGAVVSGLGVTVIALGVALWMIWKAPGIGDSVRAARATARTAGGAVRLVTGPGSASAGVRSGIQTHGGRGGDSPGRTVNGIPRQTNPMSGGIGAHSQRKPKPQKKKDG